MIYLDYNAATPLDPEVLAAMRPYLEGQHGNPSSRHLFGQQARRGVDRARAKVAELIGAAASDVVFTSGGTEANNLALLGGLPSVPAGRDVVVVSAIEHPSVVRAAQVLADRGYRLRILPVDRRGFVDLTAAVETIDDRTALVSVMLASNEVGTIQDLAAITAIAHGQGALVHCDAVQAAGKSPVDITALSVDLLSLSAHKFYGPKGVGALYLRRGTRLQARQVGGSQEFSLRAGTENVAGIVGMGRAAELAMRRRESAARRMRMLRDQLEQQLLRSVPGTTCYGGPEPRLPNTACIGFEGVDGESLMLNLDLAGIAVSVSSACASGRLEPPHALLAMGVRAENAASVVRFSLGLRSDGEEIEQTVTRVHEIVTRLRDGLRPAEQVEVAAAAAVEAVP